MARKWKMNDLLVVLPGITGSVLEKDDRKIWAPLPQALVSYVRSLGRSLELLQVRDEDPEYDDGVRATALVPYTLVPGLARFDGYSGLTSLLLESFELKVGDFRKDGPAANYFEFPYDWRRDNCIAARDLESLVERELPKWKAATDNPDAKAIFLCHSMGGLVARYYVEVLKGYVHTKALVTFGTPHRGAPEAIGYLANGYRKFGVNLAPLTDAVRTMTSAYQLLPRYPAVCDSDGEWKRVFETTADLRHLDRERARKAYEFYRTIETHYGQNKGDPGYAVEILPVVGWGQDTAQSAMVNPGGGVTIGAEHPPTVEAVFANGDGTVPRVSAVPAELNDKPLRWRPVNQKHATLQNNAELLVNLVQNLAALQGHLKVPALGVGAPVKALGLQVDELYAADEPVQIRVRTEADADPEAVTALIEYRSNADGLAAAPREVRLKPDADAWTAEVTGLPPGSYRISVLPRNPAAGPPDPVSDVFEVAPPG